MTQGQRSLLVSIYSFVFKWNELNFIYLQKKCLFNKLKFVTLLQLDDVYSQSPLSPALEKTKVLSFAPSDQLDNKGLTMNFRVTLDRRKVPR